MVEEEYWCGESACHIAIMDEINERQIRVTFVRIHIDIKSILKGNITPFSIVEGPI